MSPYPCIIFVFLYQTISLFHQHYSTLILPSHLEQKFSPDTMFPMPYFLHLQQPSTPSQHTHTHAHNHTPRTCARTCAHVITRHAPHPLILPLTQKDTLYVPAAQSHTQGTSCTLVTHFPLVRLKHPRRNLRCVFTRFPPHSPDLTPACVNTHARSPTPAEQGGGTPHPVQAQSPHLISRSASPSWHRPRGPSACRGRTPRSQSRPPRALAWSPASDHSR